MISVYGDDSDDMRRDKSLVVVGMCASPDRQWERFLPDWKGALKRRGLSGFHMEPFVRRTDEYRGWTEDEYTAQFQRVAAVIGNRTAIRLAVAVDKKAYRDWIRAYAFKKPLTPVSSYTWAVAVCMMLVTAVADEREIQQGLVYVMDAGARDFKKAQAYVTDAYLRNKDSRHFRHWSSGLLPGDVRAFPQMQTADILAYCVREIASGDRAPRMKLYTNILYRVAQSSYFHIHRPEQFADIEAQMNPLVQDRIKAKTLIERERRRAKYEG